MKGLLYRTRCFLLKPMIFVMLIIFLSCSYAMAFLHQKAGTDDPVSLWISAAAPSLCVMCTCFSMFNEDTANHWDSYCRIMPVSGKVFVSAKFLSVLLMNVIVSFLFAVSVAAAKPELFQAPDQLVCGGMTLFCVTLMLYIVHLPMSVRFGRNAVKMTVGCSMVIFLVLGMGVVSEDTAGQIVKFIEEHNRYLIALAEFLIIALLYAVSWLLSFVLVRKREFV